MMRLHIVCVLVILLEIFLPESVAKAVSKDKEKEGSSSCKKSIGIQTGFLETRDIKTSTSQKDFTATDPWCATKADDKQFMAFDLGEEFSISKIATVGKADDKNRYITSYALDYSNDGKKWADYADLFGKRELEGNANTYDVHTNELTPKITARYVKLKPLQWSKGGICTSMDLFGCPVEELQNEKPEKT